MSRVSQVFFAAACFIAACLSDPVPEVAPFNERNAAAVNTYRITSWDLLASGRDNELVENSSVGVSMLDYLNGSQPITIVVHGREGSAHSDFAYTLRHIIAESDRSAVVFTVDWSYIAHLSYDQARAMIPQVAQDLSNFIGLLEAENKLDRNLLHLVGFDLGAHVVGIASRVEVTRARKITALSPAGVGWDSFSQRLRNTDALSVEVIHTDAVGSGAFGIGEPLGTLDFFPNGATAQPGCSLDNACNHNRAWQLFAATVQMKGHLVGSRCDTMTQALDNSCPGLPIAIMGTNELVKFAQGLHRVDTGGVWPYATQQGGDSSAVCPVCPVCPECPDHGGEYCPICPDPSPWD